MKHTQGPWKVKKIEHVTNGTQYFVKSAESDFSESFIARILVNGGRKRAKANASLIAAAPELLEACKEALSIIEKYSDVPVHILALKEAIAKAEKE